MNTGSIIKILLCTLITLVSFMSCASFKERVGHQRTARHSSQFIIEKFVVAKDVVNREPVGISDTFSATTEKVFCFLEAAQVAQDATIIVVWYRDGKEIHAYELPLKQGHRWRTYAYKNVYGHKGKWQVELKDSTGTTLKTVSFNVE